MAPPTALNRDTPPASQVENSTITSSLEGLQTTEQRLVLDTVAQLRKCGLESVLFLPQIVVCGDQSAGKSSVLEALTEIPFPRQDNLCTRFATEIILRRATVDGLTVRVIPDQSRPSNEQEKIKAFNESITDFGELPGLMDKVMLLMGIDKASGSKSNSRAFARDVLSIEIQGPSRPQLILVDLPGLVRSETKGPRTICLPVISAGSDYATQGILTKVRKVDPNGERTLGIITKPDRLEVDSGTEQAFLDLARNEDVFFKLGWHVLKNRKFEQQSYTFLQRNAAEAAWFRTSKFASLPKDSIGIDALRDRLSKLLFNHVQRELPKLREDLEVALHDAKGQLALMGESRVTPQECRRFMNELSLDCYDVCKAAINGHYEGDYFVRESDQPFTVASESTIRRLRACVQFMNVEFSKKIRMHGHTYHFTEPKEADDDDQDEDGNGPSPETGSNGKKDDKSVDSPANEADKATDVPLPKPVPGTPIQLTRSQAVKWVSHALVKSRGRELPGNFNPLLIGELFWEQSSSWRCLAEEHAEKVSDICSSFLQNLLKERCPKDVFFRLWSSQLQDELKFRSEAAGKELDQIMEDVKSYPINYNHHYTDIVTKKRQAREQKSLKKCIDSSTTKTSTPTFLRNHGSVNSTQVDVERAVQKYYQCIEPDMEKLSCEEALDCMFAIYKVMKKIFIANITTQVIERHIIRGLEKIFSPLSVGKLADTDIIAVASEPTSAKRQRDFLDDRITKLMEGHQILRKVIGGVSLSEKRKGHFLDGGVRKVQKTGH